MRLISQENLWKSKCCRIWPAVCFWLMISFAGFAQSAYTLSGYVRDSLSGELLIGADIHVQSAAGSVFNVSTNHYGFYSIHLPAGTYKLYVIDPGYQIDSCLIMLEKDQSLDILMKPLHYTTQEITIVAQAHDQIKSTEVSRIRLPIQEVKSLPVIAGEVDVLKTLEMLPGVQASEGNTGLYVRGGNADQNLILLDDAPVYNTGHLFGFFSIFNADAIKNVTLIKGGIPANYGGRLSSVIDISMKDGNNQQMHGEGGIGLIASRFSIEGPIRKNKSSYMLAARRTYVDMLVKPFVSKSSSFYGSGYYFYDLNAKVNEQFSDRDKLYASAYLGRDVFHFRSSGNTFQAHIPWGNTTATVRWNHVFNARMFANTSLIYNDYRFSFGATQNNFTVGLNSGIHDWNLKTDVDNYLNPHHHLQFGYDYIFHTFQPSTASGRSDTASFHPANPMKKYAHEAAVYLLDDMQAGERWGFNLGMRYSLFQQVGPYVLVQPDGSGHDDSIFYRRLQPVKTYMQLEPRLIARFTLNTQTSLKASVTRTAQYIHLVSNSGTTLPTDLWVPSTYRVKPQTAWEYTIGYFTQLHDQMWEASLEIYERQMYHQIEFAEGYTPSLDDPENSFVFGKGWSYGSELFIHKQKGKLTGWLSYTLSWTWRKFPDLNNGQKYPARFDRRHDLNLVATYRFNDRWNFSADFVFATGNAVTIPNQFYFIEGTLTQSYTEINGYRMQPYNRLDIAAVYTPRPKHHRFHHSWMFSIYNVYSRLNPYFIYFDQSGGLLQGNLQIQAKKVALFPIIPSVTWNFSF
ncbi:outer membrane receptor protein involved in Fe transport [Thermoflavifilum aggregans]|uniref:Outer membrane receptor protein involved in Fe transport n=2 Tax=Thermoflavifilum aggregans TaxID=454188 RepID=A0A2M9CW34_9BACT|nr:TonB-dependent receptor [Thermoflavifilum aggregans]PJJ76120.1 outer membrane receptor protein involved in Fe transport [Thermoflavifilum aggregans]